MTSLTTLIRRGDPTLDAELPGLDARARSELEALTGAPTTLSPTSTRRRSVRPWIVTAVVLALVVAGSIAAIGLSRPHPQPASSPVTRSAPGEIAERVFFEALPADRAAYERAIEQLAIDPNPPRSLRTGAAIAASPQLRVDAQHGSSGDGGYQAVGPHQFDIDSSSDDDPLSPQGGNGTGADAIDVYAMRCTGTGAYTWRVLGHTVGSTRIRVLAGARGECGPGLTAARYITRGNTVATVLDVRVPAGRAFGLADIGYANFGSPTLDSAYPTD